MDKRISTSDVKFYQGEWKRTVEDCLPLVGSSLSPSSASVAQQLKKIKENGEKILKSIQSFPEIQKGKFFLERVREGKVLGGYYEACMVTEGSGTSVRERILASDWWKKMLSEVSRDEDNGLLDCLIIYYEYKKRLLEIEKMEKQIQHAEYERENISQRLEAEKAFKKTIKEQEDKIKDMKYRIEDLEDEMKGMVSVEKIIEWGYLKSEDNTFIKFMRTMLDDFAEDGAIDPKYKNLIKKYRVKRKEEQTPTSVEFVQNKFVTNEIDNVECGANGVQINNNSK